MFVKIRQRAFRHILKVSRQRTLFSFSRHTSLEIGCRVEKGYTKIEVKSGHWFENCVANGRLISVHLRFNRQLHLLEVAESQPQVFIQRRLVKCGFRVTVHRPVFYPVKFSGNMRHRIWWKVWCYLISSFSYFFTYCNGTLQCINKVGPIGYLISVVDWYFDWHKWLA